MAVVPKYTKPDGTVVYGAAPTQTDVRREASEQRVQTFGSGGQKISDTARVEVTVQGEKKWVTPERALDISSDKAKIAEAEGKIARREKLEQTIRARYEKEAEKNIEIEGMKLREREQITPLGGGGLKSNEVFLEAIKTPIEKEKKVREPLLTTDVERRKSQEQIYQEIYQPKPNLFQSIKGIYSGWSTVQEGEGWFGRGVAKLLPDVAMPSLLTETGVPTSWKGKTAEQILSTSFYQRVKEGAGFDVSIKESKLTGERIGTGVAIEKYVGRDITKKLRKEEKQISGQIETKTKQRIESRISKEIDVSKIQTEQQALKAERKAQTIVEEENIKAQKEYEEKISSRTGELTLGYETRVKGLTEQIFKQKGLDVGGDRETFMMSTFGEKLGLRKPFESLVMTGRKYEAKEKEAKGPLTKEELALQTTTPWMKESILTGMITPIQPMSEKEIYERTSKSAYLGAGLIRKPEKTLGMVALGASLGVGIPYVSAKVSTAALFGSTTAKWALPIGKVLGYGLGGAYAYGVHKKIQAQPTRELKYITAGEEVAGFTGLVVGGKIGFDYLGGARYQTVSDIAQVGIKQGGLEQEAIKDILIVAKAKGKIKLKPSTIKFMEVKGMQPKIEAYLKSTLPKEQGILGGTTAQTAYEGALPKGKQPGDIDIWAYFPKSKAKAKAVQAREAGLYVETFTPTEGRLFGDVKATTYWGKKIANIPRYDIMSSKSLRIWESKTAKVKGVEPVLLSYHTMTFYRSNPFQTAPVTTLEGIKIVSAPEQFGRKAQGFFTGERTKDYPSLQPMSEILSKAAKEQLKGKIFFGRQRVASAQLALQQFESTLGMGFISAKKPQGFFINVMDKLSDFTKPKKQVEIKPTRVSKGIIQFEQQTADIIDIIKTPQSATYKDIKAWKLGLGEEAEVSLNVDTGKFYKIPQKVIPYGSYATTSLLPSTYQKLKYGLPKYSYGYKQKLTYVPKKETYEYKPYDYLYKPQPYKEGSYKYPPYDYKYKPYDYGYKYDPYSYDYKYPYKPIPYVPPLIGALDFFGGRGGYRRRGRKKKSFAHTPDFIASVLNQYGPAPREGQLFTGQERRYKIRGKGFVTPLNNGGSEGIFGLIRRQLRV